MYRSYFSPFYVSFFPSQFSSSTNIFSRLIYGPFSTFSCHKSKSLWPISLPCKKCLYYLCQVDKLILGAFEQVVPSFFFLLGLRLRRPQVDKLSSHYPFVLTSGAPCCRTTPICGLAIICHLVVATLKRLFSIFNSKNIRFGNIFLEFYLILDLIQLNLDQIQLILDLSSQFLRLFSYFQFPKVVIVANETLQSGLYYVVFMSKRWHFGLFWGWFSLFPRLKGQINVLKMNMFKNHFVNLTH